MSTGSDVTTPSGTEEASGSPGRLSRVDARIARVRANDRRRRAALAGAVVVGLALAWVHWTGLVAAGALVGLTRRGLVGAIAAGIAFGLFAVVATVVAAPAMSAGEFAALTPLNYAAVALGLLLPAWGSLARYVA